jgi:hypothetical protein
MSAARPTDGATEERKMRRMALLIAVLATIVFAGPVSANHEMWQATLKQAGIHGTVTVSLNPTHTGGKLWYNLDGLKDGNAFIDVNGGKCGDLAGNGVVLRYTYDRNFQDGKWVGWVPLPENSAGYFKHDQFHHDGVNVTVRNEGRAECRDLEQIHP